LINVSRGGLIDSVALVRALDSGQLSGAALDVVEGEPTPPANVIGRPDVIVTPHVAFSSDASLLELRRRCSEEVVRVLRGEAPQHPCNVPVSSA
jgi:D-3-phosphoglycerate dehydrogenase / 2-oxoglutarate reductase